MTHKISRNALFFVIFVILGSLASTISYVVLILSSLKY